MAVAVKCRLCSSLLNLVPGLFRKIVIESLIFNGFTWFFDSIRAINTVLNRHMVIFWTNRLPLSRNRARKRCNFPTLLAQNTNKTDRIYAGTLFSFNKNIHFQLAKPQVDWLLRTVGYWSVFMCRDKHLCCESLSEINFCPASLANKFCFVFVFVSFRLYLIK